MVFEHVLANSTSGSSPRFRTFRQDVVLSHARSASLSQLVKVGLEKDILLGSITVHNPSLSRCVSSIIDDTSEYLDDRCDTWTKDDM